MQPTDNLSTRCLRLTKREHRRTEHSLHHHQLQVGVVVISCFDQMLEDLLCLQVVGWRPVLLHQVEVQLAIQL